MSVIVLVGGNGYIGREITRQWLSRDAEAQIYITSRSDRQEVRDSRVHHIHVDVNDAEAFEKALPEKVDYIVNLTLGSMDALKTIRDFAEKHGTQAIGNISCNAADAAIPGFGDFVKMKDAELQFLREGKVRVADYDLTIAYGTGRDDDLAKTIASGAMDELPPVHVEVVARLLIDRLTKSWIV